MGPTGWTSRNLRHAATILWQGNNPAAAVYDSLGPDFFLALDAGWLNLGLWEGDGTDPAEAPIAVRRLVATLAAELPSHGVVLDVGNGLGEQDPLIAEVAEPRRLIALNITESQLRTGRAALMRAGAIPVNGDATRIPLREASVDGVISVEAAFHFPSRAAFFAEAFRVLRPGGVLTMSDVPTQRMPRRPAELAAGVSQLRVWGLRTGAAESAEAIAGRAESAGFREVRSELVGERVIGPALAFVRTKLDRERDAPLSFRLASRVMLSQVDLLWRRRVIDYLLLRAVKPSAG
jgi:erythromycin 3''-O-methyltransferase